MTRLHATSLLLAAAALVGGAVLARGAASVDTDVLRYDILVGNRAVGEMRIEVMTVGDLAIFEEKFTAPFRVGGESRDAGFSSQVVYRGGKQPNPSRGEVTTRIGEFKIMSGKVTFKQAEGQWAAEYEVTGFADTECKPFETARAVTKTVSTPGNILLTHAAFMYFAPRLLEAPGKIENVVHVEFPDDIGFPEMLNFQPNCILQRHAAGPDGKADITLHRVFAGGNIIPLLKMTVDAKGAVVEMTLGKFTLRPSASPLEK
jgi:hypothetical protein